MKQVIIVVAMLSIITGNVYSQISKGNVLLGGTLGFAVHKDKIDSNFNTRQFGFFISPKIGVAVTDKWVVGVGLDYTVYVRKGDEQPGLTYSEYRAVNHQLGSPFLYANYYKKIIGKFYFVPEMQLGDFVNYTYYKVVYQPNDETIYEKIKSSGVGVSVLPSFAFFITHRLLFTASYGRLGFYTQKGTRESKYFNDPKYESKTSTTALYANFSPASLYLGLTFVLNNKKAEE